MNQLQAAQADLDRALELDGTSAWALACRGYLRRYLGDYQGAIDDFDRSLAILPQRQRVFMYRAEAGLQLVRSRQDAAAERRATLLGHAEASLANLLGKQDDGRRTPFRRECLCVCALLREAQTPSFRCEGRLVGR